MCAILRNFVASPHSYAACALLVIGACSDDAGGTNESGSTSVAGTSTTAGTMSTSTADTTTAPSESGALDSGSSGAPPGCGDGLVQPGELCYEGPIEVALVGIPSQPVLEDLDGDGLDDLLLPYAEGMLGVLKNDGASSFGAEQTYEAGLRPWSVATGMIDTDGSPDVVTVDRDGRQVFVRMGYGDGTLGDAVVQEVALEPIVAAIGDVDGDDDGDIAVVSKTFDGIVSLLTNSGNGAFDLPVELTTGGGASAIALVDVDSDAHLDILVVNDLDGALSLRLGQGDGTFGEPASFGADIQLPLDLGIGDFDGDDTIDAALISNEQANVLSVLLNNGGSFGTPGIFELSSRPIAVAVADIDSDENLDLLFATRNSAEVVLHTGSGDGTFEQSLVWSAANAPLRPAVGEINGDGAPDVVIADADEAKLHLILSNP